MEDMKKKQLSKVANVFVEEINSVDRLHVVLDLGRRMAASELFGETFSSVGYGCGFGCHPIGFGCGFGCGMTNGGWDKEQGYQRYAIDALGEKELTKQDVSLIRTDFEGFHSAVMSVISERLSLRSMKERE